MRRRTAILAGAAAAICILMLAGQASAYATHGACTSLSPSFSWELTSKIEWAARASGGCLTSASQARDADHERGWSAEC